MSGAFPLVALRAGICRIYARHGPSTVRHGPSTGSGTVNGGSGTGKGSGPEKCSGLALEKIIFVHEAAVAEALEGGVADAVVGLGVLAGGEEAEVLLEVVVEFPQALHAVDEREKPPGP